MTAADPEQRSIERWALIYERVARALEHSADLADEHAERHGRIGQRAAARHEHLTADRAREAAQRARDAAGRYEHSRDA